MKPAGNSKNIWIGVGIGVATILAILGGLAAAGVLRVGAPESSGGLKMASQQTGSAVQVPAQGPPPVLQQAAPDAPVTMPDDIRDWLEHLRRIEEERKQMTTHQISEAMVSMASLKGAGAELEILKGLLEEAATGESGSDQMASPSQGAAADTQAMRQAWIDLRGKFLTRTPPQECQPIADRYDRVLRETGGMMGDIVEAFTNAQSDPSGAISALQGMKGRSRTMIDEPAREADRGVGDICAKYETRKWFDIARDIGGGGMMGMPGF